MKFQARFLSVTVVIFLLATSLISPQRGEAANTAHPALRIGVYRASVWSLPIFAAESQGFFAKNGLQVNLVPVTSGPNALAALAGGSIDVFSASPELVLPAVARGVKVQVISGMTKMFWELLANDTVAKQTTSYPASLQVLKGKKIGVIALGSNSDAMLQAMLADAGIPLADVTRVSVGIGPTAAAALDQNLVQAVVTAPPASYDTLSSGHSYVLADLRNPAIGPSSIRNMDYEANWAESAYIKANPAVISQFQKALCQAVEWLQAPANREAVKKFVATTMPDPAVLKNIDLVVSENIGVFTATYSVESLQAYNTFDLRYGFLKKELSNIADLLAPGVPTDAAAARRLALQ